MKKLFYSLFTSKKFIASLVGMMCTGWATLGFDLDPESVMAIVSPIMAYIVGQGVADVGKEKAKIEKQS